MKLPYIIGLSGPATVGKDSVGNAIITYFGLNLNQNVERVAFGDGVKQELERFCLRYYGFSCINATKEQKRIIRDLMIGHGRGRRLINPDVWIGKVAHQVSSIVRNGDGVVFTDVRYKNEAEYVNSLGGIVIYLDRDGIEAAGAEEAESLPEVKKMADIIMNLKNDNNEDTKQKTIYSQVESTINLFDKN